ncbi:ArsR/SmtB family transcription factor [Agromyces subbeticus]|uniref:ArsR/SmtB family transcription factor n=1 Tax=Agromyces subbeticus TaxID=293890 RepID=UPI0003B67C2F|nr:metalloregulator ArsR/SmtB family transcription factor [Agromyces subbeticus]
MDAFEAIADDTRRRILLALADEPRTAGALAANEVHSRPAVSRHLRVLRESTLVRARSVGRTRVYSLDPAALAPVRELLARLDASVAVESVAAEVGARHPSPASPPFAPEHFDALELEVRRAAREPGVTEREGIA